MWWNNKKKVNGLTLVDRVFPNHRAELSRLKTIDLELNVATYTSESIINQKDYLIFAVKNHLKVNYSPI